VKREFESIYLSKDKNTYRPKPDMQQDWLRNSPPDVTVDISHIGNVASVIFCDFHPCMWFTIPAVAKLVTAIFYLWYLLKWKRIELVRAITLNMNKGQTAAPHVHAGSKENLKNDNDHSADQSFRLSPTGVAQVVYVHPSFRLSPACWPKWMSGKISHLSYKGRNWVPVNFIIGNITDKTSPFFMLKKCHDS
jgi:hypothetical protein